MHFKVSAVLPIDAHTFLVERDSAAFRALVAKTQKLGALEIEDGWWDGEVQVRNCCDMAAGIHDAPAHGSRRIVLCKTLPSYVQALV